MAQDHCKPPTDLQNGTISPSAEKMQKHAYYLPVLLGGTMLLFIRFGLLLFTLMRCIVYIPFDALEKLLTASCTAFLRSQQRRLATYSIPRCALLQVASHCSKPGKPERQLSPIGKLVCVSQHVRAYVRAG